MPTSGIEAVGGPPYEETEEVAYNPGRHRHELSGDGGVTQSQDDGWGEKRERAKGYAVACLER